MLGQIKNGIKRSLPEAKVDRLREANKHFRQFLNALRGSSPKDGQQVNERTSFRQNVEGFLQAVKSYNAIPAGSEREAAKRALMEKVTFDKQYKDVLETPYLKALLSDSDTYNCMLAAVRYAQGEVEEAIALFEAAIQLNPTPFNYLCLSRCASHGLLDDNRTVAILESALQHFPDDFSLILSKATAHFRLGETTRANEYLASIHEELVTNIRASDPKIAELEAEISEAIANKLMERPEGEYTPTYSEERVQIYWQLIWYHMNTLTRYQHGWSGLNYLYQRQLKEILTEIDPRIRTVINFGVFCAQPDYTIAKQFPETMFFGVDLQKKTKELNENAYQAPNLSFLAANIMDVLPELSQKGSPSLLFHARTATLFYPDLLRTIYRACADAGVEYIALWENSSLSRSTLRFHNFEDLPADSIPYFSVMFIHNYEKIFEETGYKIVKCEQHPSNSDLLEETKFLGDGHMFVVAKRVG